MARTRNAEAHAVRRDTFVDAALRLMYSKGYEQLSVQDLLDETGASKGAFYHYFGSKQDLLEAIIERITDGALAAVAPITSDPNRTAVEKLTGLFSGISGWKTERRDLMLAVMEVWMSDDNIVVRDKFRASLTVKLGGLLAQIVAEGKADGSFDVDDPAMSAGVLIAIILGANETASRLFLDSQRGIAGIEDAKRLAHANEQAFERVLGAPRGSFNYIDDRTLEVWFG